MCIRDRVNTPTMTSSTISARRSRGSSTTSTTRCGAGRTIAAIPRVTSTMADSLRRRLGRGGAGAEASAVGLSTAVGVGRRAETRGRILSSTCVPLLALFLEEGNGTRGRVAPTRWNPGKSRAAGPEPGEESGARSGSPPDRAPWQSSRCQTRGLPIRLGGGGLRLIRQAVHKRTASQVAERPRQLGDVVHWMGEGLSLIHI